MHSASPKTSPLPQKKHFDQNIFGKNILAGYTIVALEQSNNSAQLNDFSWPDRTVVLLGHEKTGILVMAYELWHISYGIIVMAY